MDRVNCNLCGSDDFKRRWTLHDQLHPVEGRFELGSCRSCGLVFLNPRPSFAELEPHYPSSYHKAPPEEDQSFRWREEKIPAPPGRILDVGCGNGGFLRYLDRRGWDVLGIDRNDSALAIASEILGSKARKVGLLEAAFPDGHFDVVTLFEVFEHVDDPTVCLKEIQRILKPGGVVVLSVPNFFSGERLLFGRWWHGLDAPRHLFQFTPKTLMGYLKEAGFEVVELKSVGAFEVQRNRSPIDYSRESLRYFLREKGYYPALELPPPPVSDAKAELRGAEAEPPPKGKNRERLKKIATSAEKAGLFAFWVLCGFLDMDNTLFACGRKNR